jgi:hypothetical protein
MWLAETWDCVCGLRASLDRPVLIWGRAEKGEVGGGVVEKEGEWS